MLGARAPLQIRSGRPSVQCYWKGSSSNQAELSRQHEWPGPSPPSLAQALAEYFGGFAPAATGEPSVLIRYPSRLRDVQNRPPRRALIAPVEGKRPLS